jgi:hypothetical protein
MLKTGRICRLKYMNFLNHHLKNLFRRRMPKNSKNSKNSVNSRKGNSFELLDKSDGDDSTTVQTTTLKRTQPFEPNSPPRASASTSTKATTSQTVLTPLDTDQWVQHRAEKAERRIEAFTIASIVSTAIDSPRSDSRSWTVTIPEIKEGNADA